MTRFKAILTDGQEIETVVNPEKLYDRSLLTTSNISSALDNEVGYVVGFYNIKELHFYSMGDTSSVHLNRVTSYLQYVTFPKDTELEFVVADRGIRYLEPPDTIRCICCDIYTEIINLDKVMKNNRGIDIKIEP